ncbi:MAG: hypothetical protein PHX87_02095 [Candidatus Peribacteraceae bacterium]|nr:hypothetical protein [Candidatus Peribacteraceae bacterium]MDD5742199.1 hypothetical protein [Candidatus Peribacteraceae bacterium]
MMYSFMNTSGWGTGFVLFLVLHMFAMVAFGIGIAFLLFWAFKRLSEKKLWMWGWILVSVGLIFCLLTFPTFVSGMRGYGFSGGMMPWLYSGGFSSATASDESASNESEQGKALYDKLQAKQITCADLSDDDFDLLGDYFMGLRAGAAHEQVDTFMQQMMGEEAEKQMHIIMGRRLSGCSAGGAALEFPQGMMGGGYGGGMMGGYGR